MAGGRVRSPGANAHTDHTRPETKHVFIGFVVSEIKAQWAVEIVRRPEAAAPCRRLEPLHSISLGVKDRRAHLQHHPPTAQHKHTGLMNLRQQRLKLLLELLPLLAGETAAVEAKAEALVLKPGPRPSLQLSLQALRHSIELGHQCSGTRITPAAVTASDLQAVVTG